jgi:prepilin-type N-terminal cleavage/methylation domain-containing protein
MSRGAFTLVEMLVAMLISAIIVILSVMTFHGVSASWTSAAEYMDKFQRSDYALNQVVGALRSMY